MDDLNTLQKIIEDTRDSRKGQTLPLLSPQERDTLLKQYHPDYRADAYRPVRIGANAGEKTVHEVADLLEGQSPPGLAGPRVPITVAPGESRVLDEAFPQTTSYTGVVADYYRAPGDPEGTRRAVVPARCGRDTPRLTLSAHDLLVSTGAPRR